MYLTQKNQIRNLSKGEFAALKQLCRLSKNLYNVGLYTVRQYFFAERKHLQYESAYHYCKANENYRLLNTDIAQQTLKVVDRSFRSFFGLLKLIKQGSYRYQDAQIPKYLKKDGYFCLILPRIRVKNGYFDVPMSNQFRKQYGSVRIAFPERLNGKSIKEVRIHPKYNARFFEVEYIYQQEPEPRPVNPDNALAIDLGLNNLASCVSTTGASFIVDGKPLKSSNQWFNKQNARLQSIKDLQGLKGTTERQSRLTLTRNNKVRDYLNKAARYIVDWCIVNKVGTLIVGYNLGLKQESNMGKRNNQNFVQIPHWSFKAKLKGLCDRYGLNFVEQEESYTSQASFVDGDILPVYNADNPQEYAFSGRRIKRGLYRSSVGHLISADCNGAANIGRKSKHDGFSSECLAAVLAQPLRVKIS